MKKGSVRGPGSHAKAKQSCAECRRLKLRCDKTTWPCQSCIQRGCAEICPDGTLPPLGRTSRAKLEREALAARVETLEAMLVELGAGHRIPPSLDLPKNSEPVSQPEASAKVVGDEDELLLVSGVGSLMIDDEGGGSRFFGLSAGAALLSPEEPPPSAPGSRKSVSPVLDKHQPSPSPTSPIFPRHSNAFPLGSSDFQRLQDLETLRGMLPPREEAERLARIYFDVCAFMFSPMEAAQLFEEYLPNAYQPQHPQGPQLACVFVILALGIMFDRNQPPTPHSDAVQYFALSQSTLAASRFLSTATIATVQVIQLSGNYLFNSSPRLNNVGELFYPLVGIGMRQVVSMGLHRDGSNWGLSGEELNRRRLLFYELITLDRLQAFTSGRPYMIQEKHYDTEMPEGASEFQICKWKLAIFMGRVIDDVFSVKPPTIAVLGKVDSDLRKLFESSPESIRSLVLPTTAFVTRPVGPPTFRQPPAPIVDYKGALQNHSIDLLFSQILLFLHKPAFAQALENPEPLQSGQLVPSVNAVILEAGPFVLALAKSWIRIDPVLCPRWWHIFFHSFAAAASMASLVLKCPNSILTPHAWDQLTFAVEIFQEASKSSAPASMLLPRVQSMRSHAFTSLQNAQGVPRPLDSKPVVTPPDSPFAILGTSSRLSRKPKSSVPTPQLGEAKPRLHQEESTRGPAGLAQELGDSPSSTSSYSPYSSSQSLAPEPRYDPPVVDSTYRLPSSSSVATSAPVDLSTTYLSQPIYAYPSHRIDINSMSTSSNAAPVQQRYPTTHTATSNLGFDRVPQPAASYQYPDRSYTSQPQPPAASRGHHQQSHVPYQNYDRVPLPSGAVGTPWSSGTGALGVFLPHPEVQADWTATDNRTHPQYVNHQPNRSGSQQLPPPQHPQNVYANMQEGDFASWKPQHSTNSKR
ncbi:hypothetical protein T439DRAFT_380761 [Meredithblackwellia eburnea MCA 4105]